MPSCLDQPIPDSLPCEDNADGAAGGQLGVNRDLTARKTAEARLRTSEANFTSLLASLRDLLFILDDEGRILLVNDTALTSLGYAETELLGQSILRVHSAEHHEATAAILQGLSARQQTHCDLPLRTKSGTLIPVDTQVSFGKWNGENAIFCISRDVSERKRAEEAIGRLNEIQRQLMRLATDFVNVPVERQDDAIRQALATVGHLIGADRAYLFSYNFHAGLMSNTHEWCAHDIAPAIAELQNLPMADFSGMVATHGKGDIMMIPCVADMAPDSAFRKVLESERIQSLITLPLGQKEACLGFVGFDAVREKRVWRDEEVALLRVLAELFEHFEVRRAAERKITRLSAAQGTLLETMAHDVTEMKRLQEGLEKARDEAQAAAKAKSLFLGHMSHEIRTPLNAILGYAQLMSRSCSTCAVNQRGIETILKSGEHLLGLLNNILISARSDNLESLLEASDFDFHLLLADTRLLLNERVRNRPVTLSAAWAPDVPKHLHADCGKIRQVLLNLVGNAIKFTEKGSIRIEATVSSPAAGQPPDAHPANPDIALVVTVTDTGLGIPKDFLPRLFQPFEQVEQRADSHMGIGLGLPISRQIARDLGGEITVQSVEGQGSVFRFTFVAKVGAADGTGAAGPLRSIKGLAADETRRRVLVVDDDTANRNMLSELLRRAGFQPSPASSGQEALALLAQPGDAFEVVLMDKRMPGMDGTETLRHIRGNPDLAGLPVLFVTASMPDADTTAQAAGANGVVFKPLRRSQLLQEIQRVTGIRFDYELKSASPQSREPRQEHKTPPHRLLSKLPPPLIAGIEQAVLLGDIRALRGQLESVGQLDAALAEHLRVAVSNYDYDALNRLITLAKGTAP